MFSHVLLNLFTFFIPQIKKYRKFLKRMRRFNIPIQPTLAADKQTKDQKNIKTDNNCYLAMDID